MMSPKELIFFVLLVSLWDSIIRAQIPRCPSRRRLSVCQRTCTRNSCPLGQLCCPTRCRGTQCTCPRGLQLVMCFENPCRFATCPAYSDAECVADYCGGCKARYFKRIEGNNTRGCEVTRKCHTHQPTCPPRGNLTDCEQSCTTDSCPVGQLCCRTQCGGRQCTCPNGLSPVICFESPCWWADCPAFPEAECVDDFCGGCHARFFMKGEVNGTRGCEITSQCHDM